MRQPWNRELAHSEVPRGVAGPRQLQIVAVAERQLDPLAFELVWNHAVVDALDLRHAAVAAVIQPATLALHLGCVDRAHTPHLIGDDEVGPRLLPARLD